MGQITVANLFPLEGIVFFPTLTLPLNIFEPRYISMVNDCLEHNRPLAVTDIDPTASGSESEIIVGLGQVNLYEKRPDGTMVILVRGTHRARVLQVQSDSPYIRCELEVLGEDENLQEVNLFFLNRLRGSLRDWADQTLPDRPSRIAFLEGLEAPRKLLETYAHYRIADADVRQEILETQSLDRRVELLRQTL